MATSSGNGPALRSGSLREGESDVAAPDGGAASAAQRVVRVAVLGDARSGKASLVRRLITAEFDEQYLETLGIEVSELAALEADSGVQFQIACCSGAPRYLPIIQLNLRAVDLAILVYDVQQAESLQRCAFWRNEVSRISPRAKQILVGTKIDVEDLVHVTEDAAQKQADAWSAAHFRVSSKDSTGITKLRDYVLAV
mmetsp:Transcript_16550/g.52749  ORF Transcript_16550/g.52749 Transcript_16550/m.52749 type:complete len:197 (+) Transcript_16550:883-1473(+)